MFVLFFVHVGENPKEPCQATLKGSWYKGSFTSICTCLKFHQQSRKAYRKEKGKGIKASNRRIRKYAKIRRMNMVIKDAKSE